MDIGTGTGYPSTALSNFAPHSFVIYGVECASMEGFLQSLKFSNPEMQKEVCKLVGKAAKFKGKKKKCDMSCLFQFYCRFLINPLTMGHLPILFSYKANSRYHRRNLLNYRGTL